jgi:hypothetical protein
MCFVRVQTAHVGRGIVLVSKRREVSYQNDVVDPASFFLLLLLLLFYFKKSDTCFLVHKIKFSLSIIKQWIPLVFC